MGYLEGRRCLIRLATIVDCEVDAEARIGEWAYTVLAESEYRISDRPVGVSLAVLSPRMFGFTYPHLVRETLDSVLLKKWSESNLYCQAIELCQPEDALYLRAQYCDQPEGEVLMMGMEPIPAGYNRDPHVYYVECVQGVRWLRARFAHPKSSLDLDCLIVFRLRQW